MRTLILGHTGLLGNAVKALFDRRGIETQTIPGGIRFESDEFKRFVTEGNFDFIVNCIGSIPQRTKDFRVNHELPIWLDEYSGARVIHPGTDCEMDDDEYGTSKRAARDYIVGQGKNTKIIKTSIIGIERNSSFSLMSWFLSNKDGDEVNGFTRHMWNGNTTLTWAKQCLEMVANWEEHGTETILYSECVSKYEILNTINEIFERKIKVNPYESKEVNKCLIGDVKTEDIRTQIEELRRFYEH
jgi:dTDP-4-dehydrorhamnose reductase